MKKNLFFARRATVLTVGLLLLAAPAVAGSPRAIFSAVFTLMVPSSVPSPISFTLAPRSAEPRALAGPEGVGVIEDPGSPYSTGIGWQALYSNTYGTWNTACGFQALFSNTSGSYNTAVGYYSLHANMDGNGNSAYGELALWANSHGSLNTAVGTDALRVNTEGYNNTACGARALIENTTGYYNVACGFDALANTNGFKNTALGAFAGYECRNGNYNIDLGADVPGQADDANTIRIGFPYDPTQEPAAGQNQTFIAGIAETLFAAGDAPAVVGITTEGRLGTMPNDLLPIGPQGSLLFLLSGSAVPAGYTLLGSTEFIMAVSGVKKTIKITVNIYKKQ